MAGAQHGTCGLSTCMRCQQGLAIRQPLPLDVPGSGLFFLALPHRTISCIDPPAMTGPWAGCLDTLVLRSLPLLTWPGRSRPLGNGGFPGVSKRKHGKWGVNTTIDVHIGVQRNAELTVDGVSAGAAAAVLLACVGDRK